MKKLLATILLLVSAVAAQAPQRSSYGPLAQGAVVNVPNSAGSQAVSFEYLFSATPGAVSITIAGCMRGSNPNPGAVGTCDAVADTYTGTTNSIRSPSFTKVYDTFQVTVTTLTGATLTFNTTVVVSKAGTGGGGTSGSTAGWANTNSVNPLSFGALFDVGQIPDATITNGSSIITCPNSNCKFQTSTTTPAKVGQIVFATAGTGSSCADNALITFGGANQTTIVSVDSDNQIHVNGNSNTTATATGCLAWGDDDTTALNAAGAAAGCYGNIVLPVGRSFFQNIIFQPLAGCPLLTNLGYGFIGRRLVGQGVTNTYLIPTPTFQTHMPCLSGINGACVGEPNISDYRDFTIFGNGVRCLASNSQNLFLVGTSTRALSVDGEGWCARGGGASTIGINIIGQTDIFSYGGSDSFGSVGMQFSNLNILYGDSFNISNIQSVNSVCGNVIAAGASVFSSSNVFSGSCMTLAGVLNSVNNTFTQGDVSGSATINLTSTAAVLNLLGNDTIDHGNYAIFTTTSGAKINAVNSNIGGGGSTLGTIFLTAGSSIYDGPGNTWTFAGAGAWNGLGTWGADREHSIKATCTGTVTAASTLGMYDTGPNVTLTTCTSAAIGTGIPVNGVRTMKYLFVNAGTGGVNASSGVFSVLKNGSAAGMPTCTLGTGTFCQATSSAALADGDLISVQFTTQAADTLANVKVIIGWQ